MGAGELNGRWDGVERPYDEQDVERIRGRFRIEHTLARLGAERCSVGRRPGHGARSYQWLVWIHFERLPDPK